MRPTSFFNAEMETLTRDRLHTLQLDRLQAIVAHVEANSDWFRQRLKNAGITAADIRTLADLAKLPTMCKDEFRQTYPLGMCCADKRDIAEMHMSSGSTGVPVVMPYTHSDLLQWGECMARCYRMAGAVRGDVCQITPSFGLFNGGFGMYHGARSAELFIVPAGAGNTARQLKLIRDFGTRVLTGVVSYGVRIMEVLEEEGGDLPSLEIGIFGAETFSEPMKRKIETGLGIEAFDIYGMTETGGVGTLGMDCPAHHGIHVWEDHYLVEVIDSTTGVAVPDGVEGELVITSLTRQALPVIRYRTGDLTKIISRDACACGRTHLRIESVKGRVDDMMIVKGVNFFPKQVEQVLMQIPGVGSNYQIILEEIDGVRDVRINVEADERVTGFMVEKALKETLGFSPKGDIFPIGGLPRQEGKAKRVFFEKKNADVSK